MKQSSRGWYVVGAPVVAAVIAFGWSRHESSRWQELRRQLLAEQQVLRATQTQRERLKAAQPTDSEWAKLEANHAAIQAARSEATALRARVSAEERTVETPRPSRLVTGLKVPVDACEQVGYRSPQATLETALWAAAGGNVAAFGDSLIMIDSTTQREAAKLLAAMPESVGREYGTPEQLIAFLTVRDIPVTSVQLRSCAPLVEGWPFPAASIQARLQGEDGKWTQKTLLFGNKGDGWKLVVTREVVAKYAKAFVPPAAVAGH